MEDEGIDYKTPKERGLQIEYVNIHDLTPNPRNPRVHPEGAIKKLVKSIKRFGWTNPIIASMDGLVLAGHARLKAAKEAGIVDVPVLRVPLQGNEAELYTIADNKLHEETYWDEEQLGELLEELSESVSLDEFEEIGFNQAELDLFFSEYEDDNERLTDNFQEMNTNNLNEDYICPKCGYGWSGKPKPE